MNYDTLNRLFKITDNKVSRVYVGNDCYAYKNSGDGSITIRSVNIDLITYYKDYYFSVDTNGERSIKLKKIINHFLPVGYSIHSQKGTWVWNDKSILNDKQKKNSKSFRNVR